MIFQVKAVKLNESWFLMLHTVTFDWKRQLVVPMDVLQYSRTYRRRPEMARDPSRRRDCSELTTLAALSTMVSLL